MKKIIIVLALFLSIGIVNAQNPSNSIENQDLKLAKELVSKKEYEKAMEHFKKAADSGDITSIFAIGYMYYNGYGVSKDYNEAIKWYKKSYEKNKDNKGAISMIAKMYYKGEGVTKDIAEALKWYKKNLEIDENDTECMLIIAEIYCTTGEDKVRSVSEGIEWYKKATNKGNEEALLELANVYYTIGKYSESLIWYKKAYEAGFEEVKDTIADIYKNGLGDVEKDIKLAEEWHNK